MGREFIEKLLKVMELEIEKSVCQFGKAHSP